MLPCIAKTDLSNGDLRDTEPLGHNRLGFATLSDRQYINCCEFCSIYPLTPSMPIPLPHFSIIVGRCPKAKVRWLDTDTPITRMKNVKTACCSMVDAIRSGVSTYTLPVQVQFPVPVTVGARRPVPTSFGRRRSWGRITRHIPRESLSLSQPWWPDVLNDTPRITVKRPSSVVGRAPLSGKHLPVTAGNGTGIMVLAGHKVRISDGALRGEL